MPRIATVGLNTGVAYGGQREKAFRATQNAAELIDGMLAISLLERANQPRIETVVARAIGNVSDAWKKLGVQGDAGCLNTKVVQTSNWRCRFYPAYVLRLAHRDVLNVSTAPES